MTIAVDLGRKATKQTNKQKRNIKVTFHFFLLSEIVRLKITLPEAYPNVVPEIEVPSRSMSLSECSALVAVLQDTVRIILYILNLS